MKPSPDLCTSSQQFFTDLVEEAYRERNFTTFPQATAYLVDMLTFYMSAANLYVEDEVSGKRSRETLAEMLLKAGSAQRQEKISKLKKLGDTALYVSGFFGESLQRKVVNFDYYKDMGAVAYSNLASCVQEDTLARVYREYARRFINFADVLTYISSKAIRPAEGNLLQLFEKYASGSELAREKLLDQGVIAAPQPKRRYSQ